MPDPGPAPQPDGGMGLEKKLGPLPRWAWIGLTAAAAVVGLVWWRSRKSAQPTDTTTTSSSSGEAQGLSTEQYESLLAILRDLQGKPSTEPGDTTPPPPSDEKKYVDVQEGTWVSEFMSEHPELNISLDQLRQLNPGIILRASERGYDPHGKTWVINSAGSGGRVRVK